MHKETFYLSVISACVCAAAFSAVAATPVVGNVTMTQDVSTRKVTIGYTLSEAPGIITVDIRTNDVSIGDENLHYLIGEDVNRVVTNLNMRHTLTWLPDKAWPGHKITDNSVTCRVTAWATNAPPDYMLVELTNNYSVTYYTSTNALPYGGLTNDFFRRQSILFRRIPAAGVKWLMGSVSEIGRHTWDEINQWVTLVDDYYMAVYETTQEQWCRVKGGSNPAYFSVFYSQYPTRPVESVSVLDIRWGRKENCLYPNPPAASSFMGLLRARTGLAVDLPSEAQWEYACRAGNYEDENGGKWNDGSLVVSASTDTNLDCLGRYAKNGGLSDGVTAYALQTNYVGITNATALVGTYRPNTWGMYDMHGNVKELCLDYYQWKYVYPNHDGAVNTNATGYYAARGGMWADVADSCRSAARANIQTNGGTRQMGFRIKVGLTE